MAIHLQEVVFLPRVVLVRKGKPLANRPLTLQRTRIGRSTENDIVLDSPAVSSSHAVLIQDGTGLAIEDLGSRNGTFVAGSRVGLHRLSDRDVVRIGEFTLTIVAERAAMAYEPTMAVRSTLKQAHLQRIGGDADGEMVPMGKVVNTVGHPGVCAAVCIRRGNDFAVRSGEGGASPNLNGIQLTSTPVSLAPGDVLELDGERYRFVVRDV
jgi:hypothetical protein